MPWVGPTEERPFPSLGWQLIETWYELFPSPRDEDDPLLLTDEQALEIIEWYKVHPITGKLVYRRGISRKAKGTGKSPIEAAKCITELALPCVPDGWDSYGEPVAREWGTGGLPVPWIQIASLSEDQDENTYGPLHYFLTANDGRLADALGIDAGLTRCLLRDKPSAKIEPVTSRAGSREGQPVTYGCLDESGYMTQTNGGVKLARTIRRNAGKMSGRTYETTNGFTPGENSVAESTWKAVQDGRHGIYVSAAEAPTHIGEVEVNEEASDAFLRKALEIPYAGCWWVDLDRIVADIRDPDMPWPDAERFFFNWNRKSEGKAVDAEKWDALKRDNGKPDPGTRIGVGFDGSISNDSTALIGCTAEGYSFTIKAWERPRLADGKPDKEWRVPRLEVHDIVAETFETYSVGLMLCDPPKWWSEIEGWAETYGDEIVVLFETSTIRFPRALDRWLSDIKEGSYTHDGSDVLRRHVLAAHLRKRREKADEDDGRTLYELVKGDDGRKIDAAVAGVLAYEAAMTMPEITEPPTAAVVFV